MVQAAVATTAGSKRSNSTLETVVWNLIVAAVYVGSAKLGFTLAFATQQVTAVWPPTGIALAALLLLGNRVWPAIFLGAFLANALTHETLLTAALIAVGNTLAPLLGAVLLRRVGFDGALERVRDVVSLVIYGSALAMMVSATNGVAQLAFAKIIPWSWSSYTSVWWLWWIGDSMGVLLVAPLILVWARVRTETLKLSELLERAAFAVSAGGLSITEFMTPLPLSFSMYPFIIWSALRFSQRATTLAVAWIAVIAILGTLEGMGPFSSGPFDHRLILLVTYAAVLSATGLVLGAVTAERRQARTQLQDAERRFQVLAEIVPQMVWMSNKSGWIDWFNHRWYEFTGQREDDALGWGWANAYHSEELERAMQDWPRSIQTGVPFEREARIRCVDGTYRWFLARAEPLRDVSGEITRWYGTYTDIDMQKRALQQSTRVAETLQAAFLPSELPVRPDLRFDALYLPAEQEALVGGDWYDAFELPDGRIVVSIGDVMGHGVSAANAAARIKNGIFTMAMAQADPADILINVNRMLNLRDPAIATALVAVLDADLKGLRYASAGHPAPIVASPKQAAHPLPLGGMPLGVGDLEVANQAVRLERDAVIVFYTDGITEFKRDIIHAEAVLLGAADALVRKPETQSPALELVNDVMGAERSFDDAVAVVLRLGARYAVMPDGAAHKRWAFDAGDAYMARLSRRALMTFIATHVRTAEELFKAELIIGELLANVVEHAPGPVTLEIDWSAREPVLTIADAGPGLSSFDPGLPENEFNERGRGLFLVSTLATTVHVEGNDDGGTTIRVTLPIQREQALQLS
ncbi:MAG: MASE1 domain-containing protein [Candidatus Eremiobacteraeota bacterium]|nr:MASE1 domain-containing protein [Candidatus Eremiobacteraeota bacterium]MBV8365122.1 MASE1 domain-containing protein [Candidatus Eremiobacteraeota bacterium]